MKKPLHSIFMLVALLLLQAQLVLAAPPAITADAAIVIDAATEKVVYEKNADKKEYPASMTKMLTCIIGLENGQANRIVSISPAATDVECTELWPGEELIFSDLLNQMMLISDNGAALAVGEVIGGSQSNFAKIMNQKAQEIGTTNSHFVNPNGMPHPNHYSTARDMAKIAAYGMRNKTFRSIVSTPAKNIYYLKPRGHVEYCENTNELLASYPGCTGIKTGYTRAAQGCLAAAAKRGDKEYIVIVMHSKDWDTRFTEAAALLDYAFAQPDTTSPKTEPEPTKPKRKSKHHHRS